jgi:hypothetical protein
MMYDLDVVVVAAGKESIGGFGIDEGDGRSGHGRSGKAQGAREHNADGAHGSECPQVRCESEVSRIATNSKQ